MTKGSSLGIALTGRFLVGLGSAEILNRQLLPTVLPQESVNTEAASLAKMSMITIALALALALGIGSLVDIKVTDRSGFDFKHGSIPLLLASPMLSSDMPSSTPVDETTSINVPVALASSMLFQQHCQLGHGSGVGFPPPWINILF